MIKWSRIPIATLLLGPLIAEAGGLYIYEVNPADTIRPKAAWQNPAGMTDIRQTTAQAAAVVLAPTMEFDLDTAGAGGSDGGNAGSVAGIPDLSIVKVIDDRWRAGFSFTALYGGAIDYGRDFAGRYAVQNVSISGVGLTPSVGYKVDSDLSLGAGIAFVRTVFDQKLALNNPGFLEDGRVHIEEAEDWGYQPFLGMTYRLSDRALLGAVYRFEMELDLEGDVRVRGLGPGGASLDSEVTLEWDNAQTVEVGLQYQLDEDAYLFLNADWEDWSVFDDNVITIDAANQVGTIERNWKDTWTVGATYARLLGPNVVTVSGRYVSSPVDDQDRQFDMPFDAYYKLGASYIWNPGEELQYSIGGELFFFGDAPVDQTSQGVRAAGDFESNYIVALTGSLTYRF
jgi:long-chain fatty acid transport protein